MSTTSEGTPAQMSAAALRRVSRSLGPPWVLAAVAPIALAANISYRLVLPFRISIAGLPLSALDGVIAGLFVVAVLAAPPYARRTASPLLIAAIAITLIGMAVGAAQRNELYYLIRDLRAAAYLNAGIYLAGILSHAPEPSAPFRWLALSTVVAVVEQWWRFASGAQYGPEALVAGAGLVRDATIFQYTYSLSFGVLAATIGTGRRLFADGTSFVFLFVIAATASISLTRSAWLALALVAAGVMLAPVPRSRLYQVAIAVALIGAFVPWAALGVAGSPLAALPATRISATAEGGGALQQQTTTAPPSALPLPSSDPGPVNTSPPQSASPVTATPVAATPATTGSPTAPESAPTPAPTLSARFSMVMTAIAEMQIAAAEGPLRRLIWLVGFGYGHNLATYTFPTGETVVGVTDLESTAAQVLWKSGLLGLFLMGLPVAGSLFAVFRSYLIAHEPLAAGWLATVIPLLVVGMFVGLTPAPYSMVLGSWLGFSLIAEQSARKGRTASG